jgi:carbamoyltransferase
MRILGIHDGHLSTATLLVDGRIVAMASEERFTRKKNQGGPPARSIAWLLDYAGLRGADIDAVALATLSQPLTEWESDARQIRRRAFNMAASLLPGAVVGSRALVKPYVYVYKRKRDWAALDAALRQNGIPPRLYADHRFEHHHCHAATAYYLSWRRQNSKPVLVVTADASGDGLCATVSIGHQGRIERLHSIPSYHSIGELYTRVTEMLGMKPLDHEYKVMGLAPYAPAALAARAYRVFSTYYRLTRDGLSFENTAGVWGPGLSAKMARDLAGVRFDGIAAGVQKLVEEIVTGFVLGWVKKTGVRSVAVAGGLFMNVKLNMLLSDRPEIEELFLMPSCGDESVGLGAALLAYAGHQGALSGEVDIPSLGDLYLGPEYSSDESLASLEKFADQVAWIAADDIDAVVAGGLAQGEIIGRLSGRMEWGARSLGNRAILADPRDLRNVRRLNAAIKKRDFWMPFAPSLLHERSPDYLLNPRGLPAPFMINAFRTTPLAERDIPCGLHPFDLTCRPQLVTREANPGFHHLISEFERITGVGGVINTSFNLHGEPIVCSPGDALRTFLNSDLDAVAIGKYLARRKSRA